MAPKGTPEFYVEIPIAPPSANKLYRKTVTKQGKPIMFLDKAVKDYRAMTQAACWGRTFNPRGVAAGIVVIESNWVTQEHTVRKRDVDNPIKCVLDALGHAMNFRDELLWEVHSAKLFSRREATHVWLFDLGDVVTATGGA
jgi:Holliday junction resolvase RusA-like endonuclease